MRHPPYRMVSVDPGTARAGIAVFEEGILVAASDLYRPSPDEIASYHESGTVWVREKMQKRAKFRVAHKDLDDIEALCRDAASVGGFHWHEVTYPSRWKANVPKPIHHERLADLLYANELEVWERLGPDGRDAVGVGLFHLHRAARGGAPGTWDPGDTP